MYIVAASVLWSVQLLIIFSREQRRKRSRIATWHWVTRNSRAYQYREEDRHLNIISFGKQVQWDFHSISRNLLIIESRRLILDIERSCFGKNCHVKTHVA